MKRKISTGLDNFKEVRTNNILYVDKSNFIEELLETGSKVIAISRPRRFGKTLNMSMLSYFFDINNSEENKKLFKGLNIEKSPYFIEQGQYPVISLTFKGVKFSDWESCYEDIKTLVQIEYDRHSYLESSNKLSELEKKRYKKLKNGNGDKAALKRSLVDLSNFLYKYYGKEVVILIDEYDTPAIEGEIEGYFKEVSKFMEGFLSDALKSNENLFKGVVTGITKLQGAGMFSGVNNARNCSIFNTAYKDKFGFTHKEVQSLLKEYNMTEKESDVSTHYNGYNFSGEIIYNPYSVMCCIDTNEFENFWIGSSSNDLAKKKLKDLMDMRIKKDISHDFEKLIQGGIINLHIKSSMVINKDMNKDDILNLFLYSGYLKYENYRSEGYKSYADISIPNREIREIYSVTIDEWVQEKAPQYTGEKFNDFLKQICEGSKENIKEAVESYLDKRSMLDGEKILEMDYHNFLFGMLQALESRYIVESNKEAGKGRFDIMLTPLNSNEGIDREKEGVVVELKVGSEDKLKILSKEALKQIEEKQYYKSLKEKGLKKTRLIGIAFNKKDAEVTLKEIDL